MHIRQATFPGRLDQIEAICRLVDESALEAGFDSAASYACQLAVAEASENIIKHGYGVDGKGSIQVSVTGRAEGLTLELRDEAPPFNPALSPTISHLDEDDPPVGGLGLLILHRVMDEIRYERLAGQNHLTMIKRKPAQSR
jgi:serine/threonine-protein kinase RsbW